MYIGRAKRAVLGHMSAWELCHFPISQRRACEKRGGGSSRKAPWFGGGGFLMPLEHPCLGSQLDARTSAPVCRVCAQDGQHLHPFEGDESLMNGSWPLGKDAGFQESNVSPEHL